MSQREAAAFVACVLYSLSWAGSGTRAADITWIGGTGTWSEGVGNDANWNPADEPDTNDVAIFNTNHAIDLGTDNEIAGLTMSGSVELNLNDHGLDVSGATTLTGAGTRLNIAGAAAAFAGQNITVNNGSTVFLDGGGLEAGIVGAGSATIAINAGGTFSGNGQVVMNDSFVGLATVINNNGTIQAVNPVTVIITPPGVATLQFTASDSDARIDLDGSLETGTVNVNRNQTLDIDIPLSDIFNGAMTMTQNTTLDIAGSWIFGAGATLDVNNGATGGIGGAPAGTATITGGAFSQNAGTITVLDSDGTLKFDAPFTMNGGDLVNNGLVVFDSTAVIGAGGANFTMPTASSSLTVAANRTVTINQNNFNMDGSNTATNVITVEAAGTLNVNTTDYDPDSAANAFDGTINLINGDISVTTGDAEFVMDGVLNMHSSVAGQITAWTGEPVDIGNDVGTLDADVNVTGTRQSQFAGEVDFNSDADVNVAAGATLAMLGTVNFNTVNGLNNAAIAGAGTLAFSGPVNVNEAVTLNMVGGQVDLDGLDNAGDFVNIDAPMTIKAAIMASFGRVNGVGGANTLDINSSAGTGSLTVNLDDPNDEWTLNAPGVMNLINDAGGGILLAGNDVNLNGTVNVTGAVGTTARVDLAGTINVAAASALTLQGGALADPNRLEGGTINGPGNFAVASNRALRGFGTINSTVNGAGTAELLADDGELTINGTIVAAGKIGTFDADGVLNVVNAWNTSAIDNVVLAGGVLKGGAVTVNNASGVQGHGTISSRVINTSKLVASGGTLVVQTAGHDNDWDGAANDGMLSASNNSTLELYDTSTFAFGGTVSAAAGSRVLTSGFGMSFSTGSTINLASATFEADASTAINGSLNVAAGPESTFKVKNNSFLTFEPTSVTTLGGNLWLLNNNINIEDNATFSGPGALTVVDGSHLVVDNQADVGVLLDMQGAFRPGNFNGIGRVNLTDYQQSTTGELYVEIIGTSLNQYDRLAITGDAVLRGYLNIDIDEVSPGVPFVPVLGNTFNIISATGLRTGKFNTVDISGMPNGLTFRVNYLLNGVQLEVVNTPLLSADFDEDGDVDSTDFAIWKGALNLNQLGDADGDNDSDGSDFLVWQQQAGAVPVVAVSGAVPEPASLVQLILAAVIAVRHRGGGQRRR